jgi:DDE domain
VAGGVSAGKHVDEGVLDRRETDTARVGADRPATHAGCLETGTRQPVYRAIDQHGQVIDVLVSCRRDTDRARRFFQPALTVLKVTPSEVVTDAAAIYPGRPRRTGPRRRGTTSNGMRTTAWKPITANSNTGYARCAACAPIAQPTSSSPGKPSCRTFDAVTTNWDWTFHPACESPRRSPNSPWRF